MKSILWVAFALVAIALPMQAHAANNLIGKVTSVLDGDTIKIGDKKIRFVGVDAPELDSGRSTATDAKNYVKAHCLNKPVVVNVNDPRPKDSSGRTLGLVYCNYETKSIEQQELEKDYAVRWIQYACDHANNEFWNSTFYHCP